MEILAQVRKVHTFILYYLLSQIMKSNLLQSITASRDKDNIILFYIKQKHQRSKSEF